MKPSYASFLVQVAAVVAASNCSGAAKSIVDAANFKIGAVREPPANFALPIALNKTWVDLDLNATIQQAVKTIQRAHSEGVSLLAFPELYFPGYPVAINTAYTASQIAQYVSQSMSTDSSEFKTLVSAFASANMYGSFGFSELADDKIYMGQVLIAPNGTVLMHRRKLRPSGTERDIWSDGDISGLEVIGTPYGRIGMLECWEHFHPTMTFAMQAQMENIHIASFPYAADEGTDPQAWESAEVGMAAVRTYAVSSGAYVIMPSVGSAAIFGSDGSTISIINATTTPELPYITTTINTKAFSNATYDSNGEQSWAALQQMIEEFPAYIPRVESSFFDHKNNSVQDIIAS